MRYVRGGPRLSSRRPRRISRPLFESLERRQLLSTDTWVNPSGGSWDVAANWSDGVPTASDDVVINVPGGPTITISSGAQAANSLTADDPLVISGGSLTLGASSSINTTLSVTGPGSLDVALGTLIWNASTSTEVESGTFDVASGAVLDVVNNIDGVSEGDVELNAGTQFLGSGLYELDDGTLTFGTNATVANFTMGFGTLNGSGSLLVTQAFDWTGGDMDGAGTTTVAAGATFTLGGTGSELLTDGYALVNDGTGTAPATAQLDGSPGSTFDNAGTFTTASGSYFGNGGHGGGVIFNNSGVFTVSGGDGTTAFDSDILNNSGTVLVDSGVLTLNGETATQVESGIFDVASGAEIGFISNIDGIGEGNVELNAGTQLLGSGLYQLDNGTVTVGTSLTVANFGMSGGTLTTSAGGNLDFSGGVFVWAGGTISGAGGGTFFNFGTMELTSSSDELFDNDGTLDDYGTIVQTGAGNLALHSDNVSPTVLNIEPGGSYLIESDSGVSNDFGGETQINNAGLIEKTSGSGTSTIDVNGTLSNTGSLTIGAGSTLSVAGNFTQGSSGSITIGLGGAAAGNEYGQLAITGTAALAGSVNATTASGFLPAAGASFPIITYASETGGSSLSFVGVNSGALSVLQPHIGTTGITLSIVTAPANLVVQPFTVAPNAVVGQGLAVTYKVDNESVNSASGTWTDSVYLSTQPTLNSSSVLLGRVQQTGVAANGQYLQAVTDPVPGLVSGNYYVVVVADSLGLVPELNRTSTELASSAPVQVTMPTLAPGSPVSGTIAAGGSLYYSLTVSAGDDVGISAGFGAPEGGELYVGYQSIPSSSSNLASSSSPTQLTQQVVIPDTKAGTYYVLVQGDTGSGAGAPFTLSAAVLPLEVTSVGPSQAGDSGVTTLTIQGAEFTGGTTVSLVPHGGGTAITATSVTFQSSTTLFVQFNLAGAAPGSYDVKVTSGAQQATDPSSFTVTSTAVPGNIVYNWSAPSIVRPGRISYITITYSNDGGSEALAPLFDVSITTGNATIGLPGQTSFTGSSVQVLGIENSGPAGTLPPGFQGTLLIPVESTTLTSNASIQVSLQVLTGDSTPIYWSTLESDPAPSLFPTSAWPAIFANLTAKFGSTTESYLSYLDGEASYLSQLGEYTDDVYRLFDFALDTADNALTTATLYSVSDASSPVPGAIALDFVRQFNATISGRDTMGPLGFGWTDNWQVSASADSAGNVTISDDGSSLYFIKNSDGTYTDAPGEFGTLTLASGAFRFVQTDGTTIAFNTNGSLDFEEDTNGNKVTADYNASGELTSLTASSGAAITIAYNAHGLISSITAPGDQTTTYSYDASGQHLVSYTGEFGTTSYAYAANSNSAGANALTSITLANGTGLQWTYDAEGRIATASAKDGAETETYAYPAPAEYTIMNADGDKSAIFEDDQGNVGETIDPLGNITLYSYDSNNNLTEMVAADGTTTTYAYDSNGNLTSETDALGYTIKFTYNTFGEPLAFVNQNGYSTSYAYDRFGNLLEQTNPDGTTQHYVYNALGEVTSSTDQDGQTITYAYNANGQLSNENLPGGTSYTYTYDSRGNMLTADSPGGDWSFTFNSGNLPTSIVEPFGTLTVEYDIDGNVTHIVDQTGFTESYIYDAVGRLSEVTDGSGNLIESYSYDPAGNLSSETKGNGTSTTYEYDADGDVTEITNLAPGKTTNSQMSYTYDAVGDVTSMTTGAVTTAYSYDADGELVSASTPGDKLLYAYDPDGNRTSVTDNGVVTNYVSNDVNEYTSTTTSGVPTSYQYDLMAT